MVGKKVQLSLKEAYPTRLGSLWKIEKRTAINLVRTSSLEKWES